MQESELAAHLLDVIPRTMNHIRSEVRGLAKPHLPVPQFRILARLSKGPANNSQLAEWMGVSLPAMSRMVDGLVKRGLVSRSRETFDRRQVQLDLTSKGKEQFQDIRAGMLNQLAGRLTALDPEKRDRLRQGLSVLDEIFP